MIEWDGTHAVTGNDFIAALPSVSGLATSAEIAALNNFNPATDAVARVTLVDTTTVNTDMRGTDGAGDASAAQQAAILGAVAGLNDLSAADVTGAVPTTAQIATAVEQAILNEGDGTQVLNAIVGAIGNTNVDEIALVAAIRADLERNGGSLDGLPTLAEMEAPSALTASGSTPAAIAAEIVSGSQGKVPADIQCVAGQQVNGSGTKSDPWGP